MTDMLVVVLDNPVPPFLLGVTFGESLVEQLVIDLPDVVFRSGRVNVVTYELTVIVRQAVLLADTTADCSFFYGNSPFVGLQ